MRRATFTLALLALLLSRPDVARASLGQPALGGLVIQNDRVIVWHWESHRILEFDFDGNYLRDVPLTFEDQGCSCWRFIPLPNGEFVIPSRIQDPADQEACSTRFTKLDPSGAVVVRVTLPGSWQGDVGADGGFYVAREEAGALEIFRLDLDTGRSPLYSRLPLDGAIAGKPSDSRPSPQWTIGADGRIYLLFQIGDRGAVLAYSPGGELLAKWEAAPDPVTSTSFVSSILASADGHIYVTHASSEWSSSTENAGSVMKFDSSGMLIHRVKEKVDYLRGIAVSKDGIVFTTEFDPFVRRYGADGHFVLKWNAEPPKYGLTWQERARREKAAESVGPDPSIDALIDAKLFGDMETEYRAWKGLTKEGLAALPAVLDAVIRYRDENGWCRLDSILDRLIERHRAEVLPVVERRFARGNRQAKEALAPLLGQHLDKPIPGLERVLTDMHRTENGRGEPALEHMGLFANLVPGWIAALRRDAEAGVPKPSAATPLRQHFLVAAPELERALATPSEPLKKHVLAIVAASWTIFVDDKGPKPIPPDAMARARRWASSPDPTLALGGALALTAYGVRGHEEKCIGMLSETPGSASTVVSAFHGLALRDPHRVDEMAERLVPRVIEAARQDEDPAEYLNELFEIGMPGLQALGLEALADPTLPERARTGIAWGFRGTTRKMQLETARTLLRHPEWFPGGEPARTYGNLLESIPADPEYGVDLKPEVRKCVLAIIEEARAALEVGEGAHDAGRPAWSDDRWARVAQALDVLAVVFEPGDMKEVAPLLTHPEVPGWVKGAALRLVDETGTPAEDLEGTLVGLLDDDRAALPAAKILARTANPAALPVLVDEGLKKMGAYSHVQLDPDLFATYGEEAAKRFLDLMDYPNWGTQRWVRVALASMKREEAHERIRKEFDERIARGEMPRSDSVECLVLYEDDPIESIVTLGTERGEDLDWHPEDADFGQVNEEVVRRLAAMLAAEHDTKRAAAIARLLEQNLSPAGRSALEKIAEEHDDPAIRKIAREALTR